MTNQTDVPNESAQLAAELAASIYAAADALNEHVGVTLDELKLTSALADVLWNLEPDGEPISRRDIAELLHCDPSNVTFLVDRLEARGFVERVADLGDRRLKAVRLTASGVIIRARILDAVAVGSPIEQLSTDDQRQLIVLLRRIPLRRPLVSQ